LIRPPRRLAIGLLLALSPASLRGQDRPIHLTVFAAASLTEAFQEIAKSFERTHAGTHVTLNLAGSQQLALQLHEGARADVFASADMRWMTFARDSGLVSGEPRVFARNTLVVIVPKANPARIARLQDLARPGVKLVLAAAAVPAGQYARRMLANLSNADGFAAGYARRVLANVVSEERNVRAVVAKVQLDEADAGVVYATDVTPAVAPFVERLPVPDAADMVAAYPIAVVAHAPNPEAAAAFVTFILSPEGQAIFTHHGFLPPGS
jgi:molybdate transport system substrate-binding protein